MFMTAAVSGRKEIMQNDAGYGGEEKTECSGTGSRQPGRLSLRNECRRQNFLRRLETSKCSLNRFNDGSVR